MTSKPQTAEFARLMNQAFKAAPAQATRYGSTCPMLRGMLSGSTPLQGQKQAQQRTTA